MKNADFRDTVFLCATNFGGTKFRGTKTGVLDGTRSCGSSFYNTVSNFFLASLR